LSTGKIGGNRKPKTFRPCLKCGNIFGPLQRLSQKYCSIPCKILGHTTGRKKVRMATPAARAAQNLLRYHVQAGNIHRPDRCEQCNKTAKIEGAHFDYAEPLKVRWLCRSCHVKWDKEEPKGGTILKRWEDFTGKTANLITGSAEK
jgi:hypothetical protein